MRPLLSTTFPQEFQISKNIGHLTSASWGKKTFKRGKEHCSELQRDHPKARNTAAGALAAAAAAAAAAAGAAVGGGGGNPESKEYCSGSTWKQGTLQRTAAGSPESKESKT